MQPSITEAHAAAAVALEKDSTALEVLIGKLKDEGDSGLLIEHLQTAAAYLQGAMPEECAHNLQMARHAAATFPAKTLDPEVHHTIDDLLHDLRPPMHSHWRHHSSRLKLAPRPTASGLAEFFHGADLSLGMFYPKKHVVGVFDSFPDARCAHEALWSAGFRGWEAIAIPGYEVSEFLSQIRVRRSLWGQLMLHVSRVLDTEAGLLDRYANWSGHGAGFVIAYSPNQEQAEGIRDLLTPYHPVDVHWFMPGYIRDLL